MNILDVMVYATIRLDVTYGDEQGSGTGFFVSFCRTGTSYVPAIVTNRHVLDGATGLSMLFHMRTGDDAGLPTETLAVESSDILKIVAYHPDPEVDLAAIPISFLLQDQQKEGIELYFAPVDLSCIPSEDDSIPSIVDIYMIGYPEGLSDGVNNLPLARRGITATPFHANFEGRPEFMIDCACFRGSSGSPIFYYLPGKSKGDYETGDHLFRLLGVLSAGPVANADGKIVVAHPDAATDVQTKIPLNLGYCVKSRMLLAFERIFAAAQAT